MKYFPHWFQPFCIISNICDKEQNRLKRGRGGGGARDSGRVGAERSRTAPARPSPRLPAADFRSRAILEETEGVCIRKDLPAVYGPSVGHQVCGAALNTLQGPRGGGRSSGTCFLAGGRATSRPGAPAPGSAVAADLPPPRRAPERARCAGLTQPGSSAWEGARGRGRQRRAPVFPVEARPLRLRGSPAPEPGRRAEREAGLAERTRPGLHAGMFSFKTCFHGSLSSPAPRLPAGLSFPKDFTKENNARHVGVDLFIMISLPTTCATQSV